MTKTYPMSTRQAHTATCTDTEGRTHTLTDLWGSGDMRGFARKCFQRRGIVVARGSVTVVAQ